MVTFADMFTYTLVLIALATLIVTITMRRNNRPPGGERRFLQATNLHRDDRHCNGSHSYWLYSIAESRFCQLI